MTRAKWGAEHSPRWRERRAAAKETAAAAARVADAEGRWQAYAAPEMARLEAAIYEARQDVEGLVASQESEAARWWLLADRGHVAGRTAQRFAVGLAGYREVLDGEKSHTPKHGPAFCSSQRRRWRPYTFSHRPDRTSARTCNRLTTTRRQGHYVVLTPAFGTGQSRS